MGNDCNPRPSATFPGNGAGTILTLDPCIYEVNEVGAVNGVITANSREFIVTFTDQCKDAIAAGDQKTCTITNTQRPTTGTLLITKICTNCPPSHPFSIQITVGNNPQPSTFTLTPGSSQLVTLGPGTFTIVESGSLLVSATFSGDCTRVGSSFSATGTISAGQDLTCTITNRLT
jgi:hypothetical protein